MDKKETPNTNDVYTAVMKNTGEPETQESTILAFMERFIPSEKGIPSIDVLIRSVGEYFDADRAYIFERDITGQFSVNTYEWCAPGVTPEIQNLQEVPFHLFDPWMDVFREKGTFFLSCDGEYAKKEPLVYEVLEPQGISTLMASPFMHGDEIIGFLGVDNPKSHTDHRLFLSVAASRLNQQVLTIRAAVRQKEMQAAFDSVYFSLDAARWQMIFDKNGNMTSCIWGDQFRRMLGYQGKEDFPNELSSWSDLLHPEDKKRVLEAYWAAVNDHTGKTRYSVKYRLRMRDGSYRWFAADGSLTRYENGMPKRYYGLFRDINEEVLAEQKRAANLKEITALNEELENTKTRLEELSAGQSVQLKEDMVVISSVASMYSTLCSINLRDGTFTIQGQAAQYVEKKALSSHNSFAIVMEDMCSKLFPSQADEMRAFTDISTLPERLQKKKWINKECYVDFARKWFLIFFVAAEWDADGTCTKVLMAIRDIDEEKRKELAYQAGLEAHLKEIAEKNATLKEYYDIINNAGHGIWKCFVDADGHACGIIGNEKWNSIFHMENGTMTPEECLNYFADRLVDKMQDPRRMNFSEINPDTIVKLTFAWNHPVKGIIYVEMSGAGYIDADGNFMVTGYVGDVTEQTIEKQNREKEILEAKEQAEASDQAKTNFLFNMSHDIRTPMNAIMGFTDLIEKHYDDKEICMDYIHKAKQANQFLLSLIDDVLEMSRIASGKESLNMMVGPVGSIAVESAEIFREQMEKKKITFESRIETHTKWAFYDQTKVSKIYLNILSNAFKYTPAGGRIFMQVNELPSDLPGYIEMKAVFSDTGIGMSEAYLPHVFESFSRERTSTESRQQGTGLGLAIVKSILDFMGGTIHVESELGKGTTVTVTYPLKTEGAKDPEEEKDTDSEEVDFSGKRILLAEDNDLNAEIAIEILSELGFEVEWAADGRICVDMLNEASGMYYDVILMDIQMPNMNGYEAARCIRALEDQEKAEIPIVALTANAFEEDKKNAFEAGMNGHLAKPIDVPKLMETLAAILFGYTAEAR